MIFIPKYYKSFKDLIIIKSRMIDNEIIFYYMLYIILFYHRFYKDLLLLFIFGFKFSPIYYEKNSSQEKKKTELEIV